MNLNLPLVHEFLAVPYPPEGLEVPEETVNVLVKRIPNDKTKEGYNVEISKVFLFWPELGKKSFFAKVILAVRHPIKKWGILHENITIVRPAFYWLDRATYDLKSGV